MQANPSRTIGPLGFLLLGFILPAIGCAEALPDDESTGESAEQPIIGGRPANVVAEAALISTDRFICSGAVIAPRVVLTAGHCVKGAARWSVTTPFAGNQRAVSARAWTDYVQIGSIVNPDTVDVGILVLDTPIDLPFYPSLAAAPVDEGTMAVNVGRIQDGKTSNTALFFGREVALVDGARMGFPLSYGSREVIQSGDSGGPVYVSTAKGRTIVAVNSGAGGGTQTLARVDLVKAKIDRIVAQNGGGAGPEEPPTCSGAPEVEPNDAPRDADALAGARCGALTRGDVDWFGWSVPRAGVSYELELHGDGDANLVMWKETSSGWQRIQNASPKRFAARAGSAGNYLFAVRSQSSSAQAYRVTLVK